MGKNLYRGNPKHKEPWQRGRKGSLCPSPKAMPELCPQALLDSSMEFENKRYATQDGIAFQALCEAKNNDEDNVLYWHGFPVGWSEVPSRILKDWLKKRKIKRNDVRKFWENEEVQNHVLWI